MQPVKIPNETKAELREKSHCLSIVRSVVSGHFAEASSADWSAKEVCGNVLTGDVAATAKVSGPEVFAVFQDSNVTCGTFAEASSADWSEKEGCGNILTGDSSLL